MAARPPCKGNWGAVLDLLGDPDVDGLGRGPWRLLKRRVGPSVLADEGAVPGRLGMEWTRDAGIGAEEGGRCLASRALGGTLTGVMPSTR